MIILIILGIMFLFFGIAVLRLTTCWVFRKLLGLPKYHPHR